MVWVRTLKSVTRSISARHTARRDGILGLTFSHSHTHLYLKAQETPSTQIDGRCSPFTHTMTPQHQRK